MLQKLWCVLLYHVDTLFREYRNRRRTLLTQERRMHFQLQSENCITESSQVNAWTPCGGPVLGAGGEPKENYIYKSVFTNRCTLGHAEVVEGVRKCQPCFFVPCAVQPISQAFVAAKNCDLLIPRVPWPAYLPSSDGWIPSQHSTHPAMFRQVCHIAKQVPMLLTYDFSLRFYRSCRCEIWNPNIPIVKNIVPFR